MLSILNVRGHPSYNSSILNFKWITRQKCLGITVFCFLALCGIYFPDFKEAAFSQNKLWLAVGYVISFSYGNHLCTDMKIYILLGFLVVGILFYFVAEILHRRSIKSLQLETEMNDLNNVVENKHVITEGAWLAFLNKTQCKIHLNAKFFLVGIFSYLE